MQNIIFIIGDTYFSLVLPQDITVKNKVKFIPKDNLIFLDLKQVKVNY